MKIIWSLIAANRLEELVEYISFDSEMRAKKVAKSLLGSVEKLKKFPKSGRIVPEESKGEIREVIKMGFRIIYRVEPHHLIILTVLHSRRRIRSSEIAYAKDLVEPDDSLRGPIM